MKGRSSSRELRLGVALSLGGALSAALYIFPYKLAAELADASVVAFALLAVSLLLSLPLAGRQAWLPALGSPVRQKITWVTAALLSVLTIAGNFCAAQAVARLEPSLASVLLRTELVFIGLLAVWILAEPLSASFAVGAGLALAGLAVMRWPLSLDTSGVGSLWALGAALSYALMQVITRRVIARISPLTVNAARLLLAVAMLACVPGMIPRAWAAGARFWGSVAAAALFGPLLGRLSIMYSLRTLTAAQSGLLLLAAPVFAFGLDALAFGRTPSGREILGAALMLLGIGLPLLHAARRRQVALRAPN